MSKTSYSDHPILNDLFDDEPTDPQISITVAQRELDSSESVLGQFTARARALGYGDEERRPHWTERLEATLDGASILDDVEMDA